MAYHCVAQGGQAVMLSSKARFSGLIEIEPRSRGLVDKPDDLSSGVHNHRALIIRSFNIVGRWLSSCQIRWL